MTTARTQTEAEKLRRVPGIIFVDGVWGRVPWIAGTGIDVWVVVRTWLDLDRDWDRLAEAYDWLTPEQLRAALAYYEAYPEEIDQRIQDEEDLYQAASSSGPGPYLPPYPQAVRDLFEKWAVREAAKRATEEAGPD